MTAADVARHLHATRTKPGRWRARCPYHDDKRPSLSITEGRGGRVLLYCWAGCPAGDVVKAAGLRWRDLFPEAPALTAEELKWVQWERECREERAQEIRRLRIARAEQMRQAEDCYQGETWYSPFYGARGER